MQLEASESATHISNHSRKKQCFLSVDIVATYVLLSWLLLPLAIPGRGLIPVEKSVLSLPPSAIFLTWLLVPLERPGLIAFEQSVLSFQPSAIFLNYVIFLTWLLDRLEIPGPFEESVLSFLTSVICLQIC
jgi:hypothetical protein